MAQQRQRATTKGKGKENATGSNRKEKSWKKLNDTLSGDSGPVEALLDGAGDDMWPTIRKLLRRESESAVSGFSVALSSFNMDEQTMDKMLASLEDYARGVVESKTKEEAAIVLIRMKDRYCLQRYLVWILIQCRGFGLGRKDVRAITKMARSSSSQLLSVMAAIRLDDEADNIEKSLAMGLVDTKSGVVTNKSITSDPVATSTWEEALVYLRISPAMAMTATASKGGADDDSISERECHKGVKHLWETCIAKLPKKYVLPESDRPNISKAGEPYRFKNISNIQLPVIDFLDLLGSNRALVVKYLANACENYGCFQLVNHGISGEVIRSTMDVSKRFFELPFEEREKYMSPDTYSPVRYGTSLNQSKDVVFCWRDFLKLMCHPLSDMLPHWPSSPSDFRICSIK